jgi:hypothetical protein
MELILPDGTTVIVERVVRESKGLTVMRNLYINNASSSRRGHMEEWELAARRLGTGV